MRLEVNPSDTIAFSLINNRMSTVPLQGLGGAAVKRLTCRATILADTLGGGGTQTSNSHTPVARDVQRQPD